MECRAHLRLSAQVRGSPVVAGTNIPSPSEVDFTFRTGTTSNQYSVLKTRVIGRKGWESVIGLEVHAQIDQSSKLFSSASVKYGGPVNTQVALLDAAIPGCLPVLNSSCVEAGVLTSLALSCHINEVSYFDRKHYFYADSPAGYQITQQRKPIATDGHLEFVVFSTGVHKEPYYHRTRIRQIQLEQDSGKSIHDDDGNRSLIDFNRAGIPLMEIVFEPDLRDGEEAAALVKELSLILQSLGTCNCKMEEGSLRVDANISVNRTGQPLGIRSEVKNINSIRALVTAIEFEVRRQIKLSEGGGVVVNETRSYVSETKETVPMRDKEVKQDYRFMPEPNLPPLRLWTDNGPCPRDCQDLISVPRLKTRLVELPESKRSRLVKDYGLRLVSAMIIVNTPGLMTYFESVMSLLTTGGQRVANILVLQGLACLYAANLSFETSSMSPHSFAELYRLIDDRKVSLDQSQKVITKLITGDARSPEEIVIAEGLLMIGDDQEIESVCQQVLQENPKILAKYKNNQRPKHIDKLMGLVRKTGRRNLDMKKVEGCIRKLLQN